MDLSSVQVCGCFIKAVYQMSRVLGSLWLQAEDTMRDAVRAKTNTETMKETLCRILPFPCTSNYKVVVLLPSTSSLPSTL